MGLFAAPLLGSAVIGAIIYFSNTHLFWLAAIVVFIGAVTGVLFAEKIRKKYGCSNYMSRIVSTPDIWPMDEKPSKVEKKP
jgi:uncharacterized membrane protein YfcA